MPAISDSLWGHSWCWRWIFVKRLCRHRHELRAVFLTLNKNSFLILLWFSSPIYWKPVSQVKKCRCVVKPFCLIEEFSTSRLAQFQEQINLVKLLGAKRSWNNEYSKRRKKIYLLLRCSNLTEEAATSTFFWQYEKILRPNQINSESFISSSCSTFFISGVWRG